MCWKADIPLYFDLEGECHVFFVKHEHRLVRLHDPVILKIMSSGFTQTPYCKRQIAQSANCGT